jgi:hypothetical protein
MKFVVQSSFSDPAAAARRLLEIGNTVEPVQDGRIHIEKINEPFLSEGGTPAQYRAGLNYAILQGLAVEARVRDLREVHTGARSCSPEGAACNERGRQLRRPNASP